MLHYEEIKNITSPLGQKKLNDTLRDLWNKTTQVNTKDILNGAVIGDKLKEDTIEARHIKANAIQSDHIEADQIFGKHIHAGEIDTQHLKALSIKADNIDADAITTKHIKAGSITAESGILADLSVTSAKIGSAQIDTIHIKDGAIDTIKIKDASITNAKIDRASADKLTVTNADIIDASIDGAKITDATILGAKIKSGNIDTAHIALGAITSALIEEGAIDTVQIADGSITDAKIVELTANKITSGELSTERLIIRDPENPENSLIYEINNITGALQAIQGETLNGEVITERSITADRIVAKAITADEIAARSITANEILSNTITSNEIASNTITASEIATHTITVNNITSDFGANLDISSNKSITSRVTRTELDQELEGIEIGGIRNLFVLDKLKNLENINIVDRGFRIEADYIVIDGYVLENILPDEEYTIQADVSILDGDANLNFGKISLYNPTTSIELLLLPGGIEGQSSNTFTFPTNIEEYTELRIYGIDEGIVDFLEIKIGKGSTISEYTISPEDIQARLNEKAGQEDLANTVVEYQSAIEQKADEITQSIDEKIIDFENDLTEQYRSELTQTTDTFNIKFEELHGRINDSDEEITGVKTYFNFGSEALEIGKSDSIFDIKISNSSMVFNRSNEPVAWINAEEEKLFIKNAQMTDSTIVGVHEIKQYNDDITFISYIGSEKPEIPPNGLSIPYFEDASTEEDPWRHAAIWDLSYRGDPEGLVYFNYKLEAVMYNSSDWDTWVTLREGTNTSSIDGEGMLVYFQNPYLVSIQYIALKLTVTATFEKFPNIVLQETRLYFDDRFPNG